MAKFLTPGAIFVGRAIVALLFACGVLVTVRYILSDHFGIVISTQVCLAATAVLLPQVVYVPYCLAQLQHRRRAAALGARVAPKVVGKWPGNLDRLIAVVSNIQNGYLGKPCLCLLRDRQFMASRCRRIYMEIYKRLRDSLRYECIVGK